MAHTPGRSSRRRVSIRLPTSEDASTFTALVSRSLALHRSWVYPPTDAKTYRAFLARSREADFEPRLIVRTGDEQIVGVANLSQIFHGPLKSCYLGFYAFVPFDGQGYMREGIDQILREAFGRLGLHRVEANVQPNNEASRKLVASLGFRLEGFSPKYLKVAGRWRDHERWAILAEDLPTWTRKIELPEVEVRRQRR